MISTMPKDRETQKLQQAIEQKIPFALETDDAEALLCALSYQSVFHPERHIWIDTDLNGISIDLEDRSIDGEWDNAIAHIKAMSLDEAVEMVQIWLSGEEFGNWYSYVSQQYSAMRKEVTSPVVV